MNEVGAIENHYISIWKTTPESCAFNKGPFHELPQGFKVLLFPPRAERDLWTYATCGMSYGIVSDGMELHLFSPEKSDDLVEILYALAHFHHTGSMLGLWHTVNFGRPWLRSSECNFGLISLPYLDGPTLENSKHGNDEIKFYWLIPVTGAEVDFKKNPALRPWNPNSKNLISNTTIRADQAWFECQSIASLAHYKVS